MGNRIWRPLATKPIAATSDEVYERYMRYLTGCADFFRRGISELGQFTLTKDSWPSVGAEDQCDVVAAQAEGIGDGVAVVGAAGTAGYDVQLDRGIEVLSG